MMSLCVRMQDFCKIVLAAIHDKKKIYIGKPFERKLSITPKHKEVTLQESTPGRILDLRKVLVLLLSSLLKQNLVKLGNNPNIRIEFTNWWDGTTLMDQSFFAWMISLKYNPDVFTADASFCTVTKLYPWVLAFASESATFLAELRKLQAVAFANLDTYRTEIDGREYIFRFVPVIDRSDHAAGQKASGNKIGGNHRCECCSASFGASDLPSLLKFSEMSKVTMKDLPTLIHLYQQPNYKQVMKDIGQATIPPILNNDVYTPLNVRGLQDLDKGPDNMHNCKGATQKLIKYERGSKTWNDTTFLIAVAKHLHRVGVSQMKGAQWRLLLVHYEDIILPAVTDPTRREQLRVVFGYLAEVQCIAYAEPAAQKSKAVRLRLQVLCFILGIELQQAYPTLSGNGMLYVHTILIHFPLWYEKHDFRNASTEAGEGFLAMCKNCALRFSSRRPKEALLEVLDNILHVMKLDFHSVVL